MITAFSCRSGLTSMEKSHLLSQVQIQSINLFCFLADGIVFITAQRIFSLCYPPVAPVVVLRFPQPEKSGCCCCRGFHSLMRRGRRKGTNAPSLGAKTLVTEGSNSRLPFITFQNPFPLFLSSHRLAACQARGEGRGWRCIALPTTLYCTAARVGGVGAGQREG